ncbi:hypothetical protein Tco_1545056, partial [Tanacetum coccineum]
MSPKEALNVYRSPVQGVHHSGQQLYIREGNVDGLQTKANPIRTKLWARPTMVKTPRGGYGYDEESPTPLI